MELAKRDGEEHAFYDQFNSVDSLKHVVVGYSAGRPISCGAMKKIAPDRMEIKRMFTLPRFRGKGVAMRVLAELEKWASEQSYTSCVLETGKRQAEAISLYEKSGYRLFPNYGQYAGIENSVCFTKRL